MCVSPWGPPLVVQFADNIWKHTLSNSFITIVSGNYWKHVMRMINYWFWQDLVKISLTQVLPILVHLFWTIVQLNNYKWHLINIADLQSIQRNIKNLEKIQYYKPSLKLINICIHQIEMHLQFLRMTWKECITVSHPLIQSPSGNLRLHFTSQKCALLTMAGQQWESVELKHKSQKNNSINFLLL